MPLFDSPYLLYLHLAEYVGLNELDIGHVRRARPLVEEHFPALVDDFYEQIQKYPQTNSVIRGGVAQIDRLKHTLRLWLEQLFAGEFDEQYVNRRVAVGKRHVDLGLQAYYTNAAMCRLRIGLANALQAKWQGSASDLLALTNSISKVMDLDLALIEYAYASETTARLQTSERLATLGQISGGIAHELRNPLNVIQTSLYILQNTSQYDPVRFGEHLQRIGRQVTNAARTITALTDFARLKPPQLQPVQIDKLVQDVLDDIVVPAAVQLETIAAAISPLTAPVDPAQVSIAVRNIITNAVEAVGQSGRIEIKIEHEPTSKIGPGVVIIVTDSGPGIPPEILQRIAEPLFSTKTRGLGLGLALVRAIVNRHQGCLEISSSPGQPTRFSIILPSRPRPSDQ